ncbi:MAG: hypothetical protein ACJ77F_04425 [Chloroflexota bacterium]
MTDRPPLDSPPHRGHVAERWRRLIPIAAVAVALGGGCQSAQGGPALLVASGGSLQRLAPDGRLTPVAGAPSNVRHVAAAGGSIVVATDDGRYLVASDVDRTAERPKWVARAASVPEAGFTAGIDVSPDGGSLAVVRAQDAAPDLDLVVVDLATGGTVSRRIDLGANGPPSWLSDDELALEVVDGSGQAEVVAVRADGGEPLRAESVGFALAATPDGATIAVADPETGSVVVASRASWWAGDPDGSSIEAPAPDRIVHDIAVDAVGSRVAVAYGQADESRWTIVVYGARSDVWHRATSRDVESDVPVTIDWLD